MPAARITRRRRSSLGTSAKANALTYNYTRPAARPVTFAPNLTPITFTTECDENNSSEDLAYGFSSPEHSSPQIPAMPSLFPPSETPAPTQTRRRAPAGKRPSQGYIPRPPNAFMLFRADFVRQKHVPGSIETNHGSLSKIIGETWQRLEPADKQVWEVMAKVKKAEHKLAHPNYRFKPVHNKSKKETKAKKETTSSRKKAAEAETEEARCGAVAGLLLSGYRGDELAAAVRDLDAQFHAASSSASSPAPPAYDALCLPHEFRPRGNSVQFRITRRSSSVPPAMTSDNAFHPDLFFNQTYNVDSLHFSYTRPSSPLPGRNSNTNYGYGLRRSSSARPADEYAGHWDYNMYGSPQLLQQPIYNEAAVYEEVNLFDPNFTINSNSQHCSPNPAYNFNEILTSLPPNMTSIAPHQLSISPVGSYPSSSSFSPSSTTGSPHQTPIAEFSPYQNHEMDIVAPQPMSASAIGTSFAGVLGDGAVFISSEATTTVNSKSLLAQLDDDHYMHFSPDMSMHMNMEDPVVSTS